MQNVLTTRVSRHPQTKSMRSIQSAPSVVSSRLSKYSKTPLLYSASLPASQPAKPSFDLVDIWQETTASLFAFSAFFCCCGTPPYYHDVSFIPLSSSAAQAWQHDNRRICLFSSMKAGISIRRHPLQLASDKTKPKQTKKNALNQANRWSQRDTTVPWVRCSSRPATPAGDDYVGCWANGNKIGPGHLKRLYKDNWRVRRRGSGWLMTHIDSHFLNVCQTLIWRDIV